MTTRTLRSAILVLSCVAPMGTLAGREAGTDFSKTLQASKGGTLQVSLNAGDIHITGWNRDEVQVTAAGLDPEDSDRPSVTQQGGTIRVTNDPSSDADIAIDIKVPLQFNIDLRTSDGTVDVDGPLSGNLKGSTSGGDIQLGALGGIVEMKTGGGNITAGDIKGDLTLETSGGDITASSISGEGDLSTSGGEISVDDVGKALHARTAGGNVTVGNVGGNATVSTSGGDITMGSIVGSATLSTAGGNIDIRGGSGTVKASTAGGDLRLCNVTGVVEGSTAAGDILVNLKPGANGRSHLQTSVGNIHVSVPANAKATIKAKVRLQGWWQSANDDYDIRTDFTPTDYVKKKSSISVTVNVNGGGELIELETFMGGIDIRKATK